MSSPVPERSTINGDTETAGAPLFAPPPGVALESVLCTDELNRRPSRPPDSASESRALLVLAQHLADSPRTVLQKLADVALEVFRAGSTGISLVSKETGDFYWPAIAGAWTPHIGSGTPRHFGPCGIVLDRNAGQLFQHPERYYPYLVPASPVICEVLLSPFYVNGQVVGTVWVVAHDEGRRFDTEDLRLLMSLSTFASAAHQALESLDELERERERLRESEARLAVELKAMTHLHELVARLLVCTDLRAALEEVLSATIMLVGADFGSVQLFNPQSNGLEIVAQRGFQEDFLDSFRIVRIDDNSAYSRAMKNGERVLIEDVQTDPLYEPHRAIAASAGYRAVQSTPLLGPGGKLLGVLSTYFRQPHRPSERELRMIDLYARQAVDFMERIRTGAALRQYAAELSEADRRKDEFLATLAHELRNPLAPIRNSLHILRLTGNEGGAAERVHGMMERQVNHMVRLVDDLMEVSRITRGKIELRKETVELAVVIRNAVETSRPLIEAARHELAITLPEEPLTLEADSFRLAQVVANLLNNAAKYTEEGGRIWLTARREGSNAVVSVRDNGLGIPAGMLPKVFDLFTQVDRTYSRAQGGLGIGLTLVRSLVDLHGGSVEARSDGPGRGSEFVVRLPLARSA